MISTHTNSLSQVCHVRLGIERWKSSEPIRTTSGVRVGSDNYFGCKSGIGDLCSYDPSGDEHSNWIRMSTPLPSVARGSDRRHWGTHWGKEPAGAEEIRRGRGAATGKGTRCLRREVGVDAVAVARREEGSPPVTGSLGGRGLPQHP